MVDPYTITQTASAALSLADAVRKLLLRVKQAPEFRELALAKLNGAEGLFREAKELFEQYQNQLDHSDTRVTNINRDVEESLKIIPKILDNLYAILKPLENSLPDRAKLALIQNHVLHNLDILEVHSGILTRKISCLNLKATIKLTGDTGDLNGQIQQLKKDLTELRKDLIEQYKRRSVLEGTLCIIAEPGAPEQTGSLQTLVDDERQTLEQTLNVLDISLNDAETTYGEVMSESGLEVEQETVFTPYDIIPTPAPFSRLQELLDRHKAEAQICRMQERWRRAEIHLENALSYYNKCREQECMSLEELVSVTNDLVLTQQKQFKWRESIKESHQLLDLVSGCNKKDFVPEPSEQIQQSLNALCLQSLANTLYEKYRQTEQEAIELEEAEKLAEDSRNIHDKWRKSRQPEDTYHLSHAACLELLISIYNALGKTTEANSAREDKEALLATTSTLSEGGRENHGSISASSPPSTPQDISHPQNVGPDLHETLIKAISTGNDNALREFLPSRDNIGLEKCGADGKTPLMHAIAAPHNQVSLVNQLLHSDWGASPNGCGEGGMTSLHLAADLNMPHIVDILVEHGAQIEVKDSNDETPLMRATRLCQNDTITRLLERGADISVESENGWSLLHRAVKNCSTATTTALLDADEEMLLAKKQDRYGKTALHICAESWNTEQATAILSHPHSQGALNLKDGASHTALYTVVNNIPNPNRLQFARVLYSFDQTVLEYCTGAKYCKDYERDLQSTTRRDSSSTVGTTGSSSSDGKQPTKRSRVFSR